MLKLGMIDDNSQNDIEKPIASLFYLLFFILQTFVFILINKKIEAVYQKS